MDENRTEPSPKVGGVDYSQEQQRRNRERFVADYANLIRFMNQSEVHQDTKKEILYQAIRMYSGHNRYFDHREKTWISAGAESLCDSAGKAKARGTIIKEHVIPISVSIEWFLSVSDEEINEQRIRELFDAASEICIVSKEEDKRLSAARLKKSMPQPWDVNTGDRWARYDCKEVNIQRKRLSI